MDKIEGKPFGQPANDIEKQWLLDRLKTLSAREAYQLAAMMLTTGRLREVSGKEGDELLLAVLKLDRKETTETINCLLSLSDYQVLCPAGGYEKLGEYYLRYEAEMPEAVLPYANLQQIGFRYEELHPGVFIGDCFVVLPGREPKQTYDGTNLDKVQETDWSLRLRLAAPAVPKGAWACLPDHAFAEPDGRLGEIALALRELKAETIQECELLEVRCSLPGITILQDEYDDLNDLIRDGNDLGFLLEEQGQGMPDFMEKFTAALEYENCHRLQEALDIAQNLHCYDFMRADDVGAFGKRELEKRGGFKNPLLRDCMDTVGLGEALLEQQGNMGRFPERDSGPFCFCAHFRESGSRKGAIMRKEEQLLAYLKGACPGRQHAAPGRRLRDILGVSESRLHEMVNHLRQEGYPIGSGRDGYFYIRTFGEARETEEHLARMIRGLEAARQGLLRGMEEKLLSDVGGGCHR